MTYRKTVYESDATLLPEKVESREPTVEEVLLAAADLLEQKGWVRRAMKLKNRHCMVGAIEEVTGQLTGPSLLHAATVRAANAVFPNHNNSIFARANLIYWNDSVAPTADHVISKLREAARS